ncbi:MAG: Fic family protein [Bacteroidales bacterium]
MASPGDKLAESLEVLKKLQDKGIVAVKSSMLSRVHRERLQRNHFLREVMKGWYIVVPTDEHQGDSTSWYTSFWSFCADYLTDRYSDSWCISADQSVLVHAGNHTVPHQLIIRSLEGPNGKTALPYNTSIFTMKSSLPKAAEIIKVEGIRMLTLPSSLVHCSSAVYRNCPIDMRAALARIKDSSEVLGLLLDEGRSTIAGRLAGAFRNIGLDKIADEIVKTMQMAGYDVRETDPFITASPILFDTRQVSPYVNRIRLMWSEMRKVVVAVFPTAPGLPMDHSAYMRRIEELYLTDAYNSLSIEKYKVTPELIDRVRSGEWDLAKNEQDRKHRDAMAARGYWQATQIVRESIVKILNNENPGLVADKDHGSWYRELFAPGVTANILKPSDLAGYRNSLVYISQSKHVPLNPEAVRDTMPLLFELLQEEPEASVRAVLGHFIFVYIHPYMDGNGRMARFLMNVMLASGGYPWTVIPVEKRSTYMDALERASTEQNIEPFTTFLANLVKEGMKGGIDPE